MTLRYFILFILNKYNCSWKYKKSLAESRIFLLQEETSCYSSSDINGFVFYSRVMTHWKHLYYIASGYLTWVITDLRTTEVDIKSFHWTAYLKNNRRHARRAPNTNVNVSRCGGFMGGRVWGSCINLPLLWRSLCALQPRAPAGRSPCSPFCRSRDMWRPGAAPLKTLPLRSTSLRRIKGLLV